MFTNLNISTIEQIINMYSFLFPFKKSQLCLNYVGKLSNSKFSESAMPVRSGPWTSEKRKCRAASRLPV